MRCVDSSESLVELTLLTNYACFNTVFQALSPLGIPFSVPSRDPNTENQGVLAGFTATHQQNGDLNL